MALAETIRAPALGVLEKTLALVGNPNVGKSVIFGHLTGKYVTVSNFPGTTVDVSRGAGIFGGIRWRVLDTPGINGLVPRSEDERVTRDILFSERPDVIVQVADAKCLGRSLHITLALSEFEIPMILALNMSDEALDRGIRVDAKRLSESLGIPVIETVAVTGDGLSELKRSISKASVPRIGPRYTREAEQAIGSIQAALPVSVNRSRRAIASFLFAQDKTMLPALERMDGLSDLSDLHVLAASFAKKFVRPPDMLRFEARQCVSQQLAGEVQSVTGARAPGWLAKLGNWAMRPFPGYLIVAGVLFLMYEFVGVFAARVLVDWLEGTVFGRFLNPVATRLIEITVPFKILQEVLVGPYGLITMALTYAFALILPIVSAFFLFFGLLEDSGYLPRLAVMLDRFFRLMGLNGKAVLPMVLGLGCDTMATFTTRILDTEREKFLVSLLLTLAVPCSAQLGAILGMAAGMTWKVLAIWLVVVMGTMLGVGWGAAQLLPGSRSPLIMEIPPVRVPRISNIIKKVRARLKWYIKEIVPLFALATFLLFTMDKIGLLTWTERLAQPVVTGLLGLPAKATEAFIIGFLRRDYGAAGFFMLSKAGALSAAQVAVSMVVITLFMPCVAHLLITIRERGVKAAVVISVFVFGFALAVGGTLNWLLRAFPIL